MGIRGRQREREKQRVREAGGRMQRVRQWPRAKLAVDGAEIVRDDPGLAERARERERTLLQREGAREGGREREN